MPAPTRTPLSRPTGVPAYYLARPARWWITALRQPPQHRARTSQHTSPAMERGSDCAA